MKITLKEGSQFGKRGAPKEVALFLIESDKQYSYADHKILASAYYDCEIVENAIVIKYLLLLDGIGWRVFYDTDKVKEVN